MSMASRHASQASCRSTQTGPFTRTVTLPPHVEEVLHAKPTSALRQLQVSGQGLHSPSTLLPSLDRRTKLLPWERPADVTKQSRTDSVTEVGTVRSKSGFGRQRKVTQHSNQIGDNRYLKLYEVIDSNPYGKISFTNSNEPMHPIAGWVIHQLEHSCRSARFALPSNYSSLEDMTPLEYLEKYTILSRTQRRKYNLIFAKYMDRQEKVLLFERLYPALNSMFADSLGRENFKTLCVSLFIGKDLKIQSKELFAGICALTERLFWSSYMEAHDNTFFICGENRSLLECADFCGLKGKIQDLNLSIEMRTLLFSLA